MDDIHNYIPMNNYDTPISNDISYDSNNISYVPIVYQSEPITHNTQSSNTQKSSAYSFSGFTKRLQQPIYIIIYAALIILGVLLVVTVFVGVYSKWYNDLIEPNINPWIIRGLWVVGTILSYVGFIFIPQDGSEAAASRDLIISVLFLITSFLFLAWAAAFYFDENITLSLWLSAVIFIYNFWLFIYIWHINPITAIFLIPNLILYVYLIYASAHLASLNNVPI